MPWRPTLVELLATRPFGTQGELVHALAEAGFEVTQATVSRQLAAIGATKVDGAYRLPPATEVGAPIHHIAIGQAAIAVVRTDPAHAAVVARSIDDAAIPGVLGTIAGDDTVFVALGEPRAAERLKRHLGWPSRP